MSRSTFRAIARALALSALTTAALTGAARAEGHIDPTIVPFPRTVRVSDAQPVGEPASGTLMAKFVVSLSGPLLQPGQEVKVSFATQDGTAIGASTAAVGDYKITAGTVTFVSGGARSKAVLVPVIGDGVLDSAAQETFHLNLRRVIGASVTDGSALGTIVDLQAQPTPGPDPGPGDPCSIAPDAQGPVVDCAPGPITQ